MIRGIYQVPGRPQGLDFQSQGNPRQSSGRDRRVRRRPADQTPSSGRESPGTLISANEMADESGRPLLRPGGTWRRRPSRPGRRSRPPAAGPALRRFRGAGRASPAGARTASGKLIRPSPLTASRPVRETGLRKNHIGLGGRLAPVKAPRTTTNSSPVADERPSRPGFERRPRGFGDARSRRTRRKAAMISTAPRALVSQPAGTYKLGHTGQACHGGRVCGPHRPPRRTRDRRQRRPGVSCSRRAISFSVLAEIVPARDQTGSSRVIGGAPRVPEPRPGRVPNGFRPRTGGPRGREPAGVGRTLA